MNVVVSREQRDPESQFLATIHRHAELAQQQAEAVAATGGRVGGHFDLLISYC